MNYYHRFSKLFGKCLPGRKETGKENLVIESHGKDQKMTTQVDEDSKKDVIEAPMVSEKESGEADPATEEPAQSTSEDGNVETATESEEDVSVQEETPKTDEGPPNKTKECKDGNEENTINSQDEDYKWEVSCCGVDMPLAK